jgi:aminoglycoside 6'-N-acetyltransferase I
MTTYTVRRAKREDTAHWVKLRACLWPNTPPSDHEADGEAIWEKYLEAAVFLAFDDRGEAQAFAEVFLRGFANGCDTSPVAFLEGIWVNPTARGKGVGRRLVEACAAWGRELGCREFGSDALLDNKVSHRAHEAWGFQETERVVYFKMNL